LFKPKGRPLSVCSHPSSLNASDVPSLNASDVPSLNASDVPSLNLSLPGGPYTTLIKADARDSAVLGIRLPLMASSYLVPGVPSRLGYSYSEKMSYTF